MLFTKKIQIVHKVKELSLRKKVEFYQSQFSRSGKNI